MAASYAKIDDVITLFRPLTEDEKTKAEALIPIVSAEIRLAAKKVGKDFDKMLEEEEEDDSEDLALAAKDVVVNVIARWLNQNTDSAAVSNESQSALGYSWSGTYLTPSVGITLLNNELKRLGLMKSRMGVLEIYDYWDNRDTD